eukprot:4435944-Amphidinium_carterae.1
MVMERFGLVINQDTRQTSLESLIQHARTRRQTLTRNSLVSPKVALEGRSVHVVVAESTVMTAMQTHCLNMLTRNKRMNR